MYLLIHENGTIRQQEDSPTPDDLAAIGDGVLDVVSVVGGRFVYYNPNGKMEDVPYAKASPA